MNPSLNNISITDFRSIKGTITVPLTAPVVLIHGPNGAGKTSVLSAIELVLTGDVTDMRRTDPDYIAHLIHWGAASSRINVDASNLTAATLPAEMTIRAGAILGNPVLSGDVGRFFGERCYLAQVTLGRLLEIYQNADPRADSALTRFVKELLRLDVLDALIEGLYPANDVRNTRRLVPEYEETEKEIETIDSRLAQNRLNLDEASAAALSLRERIRKALADLSLLPNIAISGSLLDVIEKVLAENEEDRELVTLNIHRRDLASLKQRSMTLTKSPESDDEIRAVAEEEAARAALDIWWSSSGKELEELISQLRETFPDLPAVASTDPDTAFQTAFSRANVELERCTRQIASDDSLAEQVEGFERIIEISRARIALIDEQIGTVVGDAASLSQALASLIPHIHGELCPVCGRDYREVSDNPLVQHVSAQVAKFATEADRIQGLARTRASATADLTKAERDHQSAAGSRLGQEARASLKARISVLTDAVRQLAGMKALAQSGTAVIQRDAVARGLLSTLRGRDRLKTELRLDMVKLCAALGQPPLEPTEQLEHAIQRLESYVASQEKAFGDRAQRRREAVTLVQALRTQEATARELEDIITSDSNSKKPKDEGLALAEQRRQSAKAVSRATSQIRTAIVSQVFNSSLNRIWRDLFTRLAPAEPFVPAFRLPQSTSEAVSAKLETVHRDGGFGGAPGTMLSAGNLNTAALTLFLALHLAVKPKLPWLILDDPIQSMDELHIANFAAVLRTLSKEHHRQLIIAVHERSLFEYLALELSPAFPDDQLITVELSKTNSGGSIAEPTYHKWQPDRAVAV
ncbi:MAG: AAA family ATPase [Acidobacteriia bacterium]|nr:AAA family ATPase [Terriglobia bacterium]